MPALAAVCCSRCCRRAAAAKRHDRQPPPRPQVSVAAALERDVTEWDEFTGRLEAVESVEIRPRVTGYIESVNFAEGSIVRKGDLLFVIDPRPYRAELDEGRRPSWRARSPAPS